MPNVDTKITYWTWDNYPYTWDETDVSWDEAYDTAYTLTNSDTLKVADGVKKKQAKRSKETAKFASSYSKRTKYKRKVSEAVKLADKKKAKTAIKRTDGFKTSERFAKNIGWKHKQTIKVVESKRRFSIGRAFAEILGVSETYWDNIGYFLSASETFTIKEGSSKKVRFARTIADYIHLAEALNRKLIFKLNDGFVLKDAIKRSVGYTWSVNEKLSVWDNSKKKLLQTINDTFGAGENFDQPKLAKGFYEKIDFLEGFSWAMAIDHNEQFGIDESFSKTTLFMRGASEEIAIAEQEAKSISLSKHIGLNVGELLSKHFERGFDDELGVLENEYKSIEFVGNENIATTESQYKIIKHPLADTIGVDDLQFNQFAFNSGEQLELIDDNSKRLIQALPEIVFATDLLANNVKHPVDETAIAVSDEYDRQIKFARNANDYIFVGDHIGNNVKHLVTDKFTITDQFNRLVLFIRALSEKFSVAETYWDNIMFYLQVLEGCVFTDDVAKVIEKPVSDRFTVGDLLKKHNEINNAEQAIKVTETFLKQVLFDRSPIEQLDITDKKLGSNIKFARKEPIDISEVLGKDFVRGCECEEFGIEDSSKQSMRYLRGGKESIGIADEKLGSKIIKVSIEEILIKEQISKILHTSVKELMTCDDEIGRQVVFSMVIKEALNVIEHRYKSQKVVVKDKLGVDDGIRKMFEQLSQEAFVLIDGFIREYIARRFIGEAVTVEDYLSKGVGLLMSEEMNTYDTLIKACEGILSNISITEGELTLDEFLDIVDRPPNYTKFIEFKVGEYEYKDALIRLTMATKVQQTQPIATNVVMHVDIPDTDDKGEVEITDTTVATKVYFNKFYYNPPEVNVNLKGGNTADGILIPNIVTTEGVDDRGRYFEVELLDETWLNRKTGKISWTSKGY